MKYTVNFAMIMLICAATTSCMTNNRSVSSEKSIYSNDLINGFEISGNVSIPNRADCIAALRTIGVESNVPSYLDAKMIFGDSMIDSGNYRFWLAGPNKGPFCFNIIELNKYWQDSITMYQKTNNELKRDWNINNDDENAKLEKWRIIRPFFYNSEYDAWYGWDISRPGISGEYEIVVIDLQFSQVKGRYNNIVEIFESIKSNRFDEFVKRNEKGKVVLISFPEN
jgi:hypothetical protein